jgi:hypothetical protein
MADTDAVTRKGVYDATIIKVQSSDETLQKRISNVMSSGNDINQGDLLGLQYELQSNLLVYNVASSIQKELTDMVKSIISKI